MRDRTRHKYKKAPRFIKKEIVYIILADDGAYDFNEDQRGEAIEMYEGYKKCGDNVMMMRCYKGGGYVSVMMNYKVR